MIVTGTRAGLVCVDAADGSLLWSNNWSANNTANCPTPAYADGYVFWANGYGKGGVCMKLKSEGGKVSAEEAWTTKEMVCHHGGYVILDGCVYGNHNTGWSCLDLKTGDVKWNERGPGKGSLSTLTVCCTSSPRKRVGGPGYVLTGRHEGQRRVQRRRQRPELGSPRRVRRPPVSQVREEPLLLRCEGGIGVNSRERVLAAINHVAPDRVPIDLGGTRQSGIHASTYHALKQRLGIRTPTRVFDVYQMLAEIEQPILERFGADCVGLQSQSVAFGIRNEAWKPWRFPEGPLVEVPGGFQPEVQPDGDLVLRDRGGAAIARMPKGGFYFDRLDNYPAPPTPTRKP